MSFSGRLGIETGMAPTVQNRKPEFTRRLKMLWRASQQFNRFRDMIEMISGVIFLATPHLIDRNASSSNALSQILRSDLMSNVKKMFTNADFSSIEYTSLRFEELKLQIPILSCHETQPTKLKGFWTSRRVVVSACWGTFPVPRPRADYRLSLLVQNSRRHLPQENRSLA